MRNVTYILAGVALAVFVSAGAYAEDSTNSIPDDQINSQKIYIGNPSSFANAAEVDFMAAVKATPQYKYIERRGTERGTAEFWQRIEAASTLAQKAVITVSEEEEYDLVTEKGYLAEVDEDIPVEDITQKVVSFIEEQ